MKVYGVRLVAVVGGQAVQLDGGFHDADQAGEVYEAVCAHISGGERGDELISFAHDHGQIAVLTSAVISVQIMVGEQAQVQ